MQMHAVTIDARVRCHDCKRLDPEWTLLAMDPSKPRLTKHAGT